MNPLDANDLTSAAALELLPYTFDERQVMLTAAQHHYHALLKQVYRAAEIADMAAWVDELDTAASAILYWRARVFEAGPSAPNFWDDSSTCSKRF